MQRLDEFGEPEPSSDDRSFGMLAHLSALLGFFIPFGSIIGPLIAWSAKKHTSDFVDENGRNAINFHITWTIVVAILWIFWMIQFFGTFPLMMIIEDHPDLDENFPLRLILGSFIYFIPIGIIYLARFVLILVGSINASNGKVYRYPGTYRFIR